jgi:ADP-ribose pyrophosphatase YjhB (NUDIX family)
MAAVSGSRSADTPGKLTASASRWMRWARELREMAQTGLTYARDPHDVSRYERTRDIAAEMLALNSDADYEHVRDAFRREVGHATPKLDVRGVVFRDGSVLLVRERSDGLWTLPGGWVDPGESPSEAVAREVREESGYDVEVTRLLALYDRDKHGHPPHPHHIYKLFFECRAVGGVATASEETDAAAFFDAQALPTLSLGRVTPAQIQRFFALASRPDLPTDFD